jgi:protein-arginine kinase activator protein McsA
MNITEANEIIKSIKSLKYLLIKGQDFENAAIMRDMESKYCNKEIKENLKNHENTY